MTCGIEKDVAMIEDFVIFFDVSALFIIPIY